MIALHLKHQEQWIILAKNLLLTLPYVLGNDHYLMTVKRTLPLSKVSNRLQHETLPPPRKSEVYFLSRADCNSKAGHLLFKHISQHIPDSFSKLLMILLFFGCCLALSGVAFDLDVRQLKRNSLNVPIDPKYTFLGWANTQSGSKCYFQAIWRCKN